MGQAHQIFGAVKESLCDIAGSGGIVALDIAGYR